MISESGEESGEEDPGSLGLAVFFLVTSGLAAVYGLRIADSAFLNEHDPGPRVLPVAMALLLCLGGVYETSRWWRWRKASPGEGARLWDDYGRLLYLQGILLVYVCLIPVLGFALASILAAFALLLWFGLHWLKAVATAVILVLVIQVLFVTAMKVQLPLGIFSN